MYDMQKPWSNLSILTWYFLGTTEELCVFWRSTFIIICREIEEELAGGHKNGGRYKYTSCEESLKLL